MSRQSLHERAVVESGSRRVDKLGSCRRGAPVVAALLLALAVLPPAGGGAAPASQNADRTTWTPWLLDSSDQFRLAPPPRSGSATSRREVRELLSLQRQRTPRVRRRVAFWNEGPATLPWTRTALELVRKHRQRPPFVARALTLLHTAMFDALIAAQDSRTAYSRPAPARIDDRLRPLFATRGSSYPPDVAVVAGAAETVLAYLFPNEPESTFSVLATEASESRLWAGTNYRSDIERGRKLGRDVAALFIARGEADGSTSTGFPHEPRSGEEYWSPTPPGFEPPTGGPVGTWIPWVMTSQDAARVLSGIPGPFAYGSDAFTAELQEVVDVQAGLTDEEKATAEFWDDGLGTYTPAGHWNDIALELTSVHRLGTNAAARLFAYLNVAMYDGAIAVFEAKYFWSSIRPVTAVRRLCDGGTRLCRVAELDPDQGGDPARATFPEWLPYIATPPFPSYPAGHSTVSGAAGAVLTSFFPNAGGELNRLAEEAAYSRLLGGIHFRSDNDDALRLGRAAAQIALQRAAQEESR